MTHAQLDAKMHEQHPLLNSSNVGLILGNLILGVMTLDTLNVVVAFSGIFVTLMANVHRIVYSVLWIVAVRRNGWQLQNNIEPEPQVPDPEKPSDSTTGSK